MRHRSADRATEQWLGSDGHREILLNPDFTDVGAGIAGEDGDPAVWTVVFEAGAD